MTIRCWKASIFSSRQFVPFLSRLATPEAQFVFPKWAVSGSNSALAALIGGLFGVRFEFVFKAQPCVLNDLMASLVFFLVYFHLPVVAIAGALQPNHAARWSRGNAHDNVSEQ